VARRWRASSGASSMGDEEGTSSMGGVGVSQGEPRRRSSMDDE
jgi:hypothetical protein